VPGIAGIISKAPIGRAVIEQMTAAMVHEPFHTSGIYAAEKLHVGWVCERGSFSDCMPVWNPSRDICVIFSGEDFSDQSEISRVTRGAHKDAPENASYLAFLYEAIGLEFVERLNGWFSGVVVDLRKHTVVLFNDRYGLNRVYYHENASAFYFSSEAKSLLKVLPGLRQLDPRGLAETISCGSVLQNRTLFFGVSLLPGASRWVFTEHGSITKASYFSPGAWESQPALSSTDFYTALKATFTRILPKYFRGKRRVAMSLTGGLDGRMIMAWARASPGALPCYTFSGPYRECADVEIARRVAKACRQSHDTIAVGRQFLAEFPNLVEKAVYVSDGTMDVTGSVELYVNRAARQIAPARMTGNYGSEILRGGIALRPRTLNAGLFERGLAQLVQAAAETYQTECKGHGVSFIAFKQVPWHHYSRLSVERSQLTLLSPYLDNDLVALMYRAPKQLLVSKEPSLRLISEGNNELAKIATDRGLSNHPAPVIGRLSHLYAELTARSEYAYDYGMPQWLAGIDHALRPLRLERLFLGRHKFYHFRVWYRDELSQYAKDILLDSRTRQRPYLLGNLLEAMVNAHTSGKRNYTSEIHRALTIELIQRLLIEQPSA